MAVSRIILPKIPLSDSLSDSYADSLGDSKTCESPTIPVEECVTNFSVLQEKSAKNQQDFLRTIYTNLHGVYAYIFNPRFDSSVYDSEDQDYHYPVIPDYEGKLMIEGIADTIRYSGEDQWSSPEITLYWPESSLFSIKDSAKIIVNHFDQKLSLRAKNKKRQIGQHIELVVVIQLVPFN